MLYFWEHRDENDFSLNILYAAAGITKQGFYKWRKKSARTKEIETNTVLIITDIRKDHPTMCCRYMYHKINPSCFGRDKFLKLCDEYGFKASSKISTKKTTDSSGVIRFDDLRKGLKLQDINQLWSSDITYYDLNDRFYYLTFIMDEYSRRIIGHQVSERLYTKHTTIPALKKAIRTRRKSMREGIIFHSDGGGQYYSSQFLKLTNKYKFKNSMCEYSYDNPKAERLNGVIKNNYLKKYSIFNIDQLVKQVDRAVRLYNTDKPHSSLHRKTPVEFEEMIA